MLQALRDNIIVKPLYEEKRSSIIIPKMAKEWKQYNGNVYGLVISVGKDYKLKDEIKPGTIIAFEKNEGIKFTYAGETYFKMRSRWIHGTVN